MLLVSAIETYLRFELWRTTYPCRHGSCEFSRGYQFSDECGNRRSTCWPEWEQRARTRHSVP